MKNLAESFAFLRHPLPTYVIDLDTLRILAVNDAAVERYGYSREEFLGMTVRDIRPADDVPAAVAAIQDNRDVPDYVQAWRHRLRDGRIIDVMISAHHFSLGDRRLALVAAQDISERTRALRAFEQSEARFHMVSEALPLALGITCLADGTFVHVNAPLADLFGQTPAELLGRRAVEFYADPTDCERAIALLRESGIVTHFDAPVRRADGTIRWVLSHFRLTRYHDEPAILVLFTDISELKHLEDELRAAKEAAEQAMATKSRLFAAASHDLRQPLSALALFLGVLEQNVRESDGRNILRAMRESIRTMRVLVDAYLDLARLDAGVLRPSPAAFPIEPLLSRLADEFGALARGKGLRFTAHSRPLLVRSDPDLLERILANLLSNAVRYTDRGHILLGVRRRGPALRIEVRDTGAGIRPELIGRIFDEFFQGGDAAGRPAGGLGLGLAIVKRLAESLGHPLEVRSVPGRGSVFTVTVPLADDGAE